MPRAPHTVTDATRKAMRANKAKDTAPEMAVRRMLHKKGFRYRLHKNDLPGKPDIAFPKLRRVVFVHGCFWHQHPDPACKIARMPKSRLDFWGPKLEANSRRDSENEAALRERGWDVITIWECQLRDPSAVEARLCAFLHPDHP